MLISFTITECEQFERYNCDDDKHRIVFLTTYSYYLLYFENIINLLIKKKNCLFKIQLHLNIIKSNAHQTILD